MNTPESKMHSFIVKLWLEETDDETKGAVWHGYITHVPGGERRYLHSLRDVVTFVQPYVGEIDRDVRTGSRARAWLRRLMRRNI